MGGGALFKLEQTVNGVVFQEDIALATSAARKDSEHKESTLSPWIPLHNQFYLALIGIDTSCILSHRTPAFTVPLIIEAGLTAPHSSPVLFACRGVVLSIGLGAAPVTLEQAL